MSVDQEKSIAQLQKFWGSTLQDKQYNVKPTEIYPAAANYLSANENIYSDQAEEDGGIKLCNHGSVEELDWLATEEIQRVW